MGVSKTAAFSEKQNYLANLAKAFAHPARVAILEYLIQHPDCMCGDIVEVLPLSQSTVSRHLKELKDIGLIRGNVEPPKVCYCIDAEVWQEARVLFENLFQAGSQKTCE